MLLTGIINRCIEEEKLLEADQFVVVGKTAAEEFSSGKIVGEWEGGMEKREGEGRRRGGGMGGREAGGVGGRERREDAVGLESSSNHDGFVSSPQPPCRTRLTLTRRESGQNHLSISTS